MNVPDARLECPIPRHSTDHLPSLVPLTLLFNPRCSLGSRDGPPVHSSLSWYFSLPKNHG
jgi:hypothetical protein